MDFWRCSMSLKLAKTINTDKAVVEFLDDSSITIPKLQILNQDGSLIEGANEP